MQEVWKDIPGYEGWYQVSNMGRVKRLKKIHCNHGKTNVVEREYILKTTLEKRGYFVVVLSKEGKGRKVFKVHRLIAEAFIPNEENKPQVDHINRIRTDNRIENLRWVTNLENQLNSSKTRLLDYKGELVPLSVLSDSKRINPTTVSRRLKSGWSVEDAVDTPVDTRFCRKK